MADDFERLAVLIEANTKSYENAMKKLQSQTERAIRGSKKSVDSLDARLKALSGTVARVAGVFGVAFGARAIAGFIAGQVKAAEATGDLAEKLGISAEALQELTFVADQSGTSQESLVTAFRGMTKLLGAIERGSKEAKDELAAIGLTIDDLKGKSPDQVFTILLDAIGRIEDPLRRNAELMKVFGKSGTEVAQLAQLGAKGIDGLRQKARELGLVLSNQTIAKMQEAGDKLGVIGAASQVAGARMAESFLPAIDAIAALVTSPQFQDGLAKTAGYIGAIVKFLAEHPEALAALGGAAVGGRIAGVPGAIIGGTVGMAAGPFMEGFNQGLAPPSTPAQGARAAAGTQGYGALEITVTKGVRPQPPGFTDPAVQKQIDKYAELKRALEDQLRQLTMNDREQAIANELAKLGAEATDEQRGAISALTGKLFDQKKALDASREAAAFFAESFGQYLSDLIPKIETGNSALDKLLNTLIETAAQALLLGSGPLAGIFGMTSGTTGVVGGLLGSIFGGFRASGGPVRAGKAYVVGERGPEIIVPGSSGRVYPNGGGGGPTSINVNVYGAHGNQEIETMVSIGVARGLAESERMKSRRQALGG